MWVGLGLQLFAIAIGDSAAGSEDYSDEGGKPGSTHTGSYLSNEPNVRLNTGRLTGRVNVIMKNHVWGGGGVGVCTHTWVWWSASVHCFRSTGRDPLARVTHSGMKVSVQVT